MFKRLFHQITIYVLLRFLDEIEKDKLISLTKSLAIKLNVNRLYIMFVDEEESLVVIVDSNNDAYVEIKVE